MVWSALNDVRSALVLAAILAGGLVLAFRFATARTRGARPSWRCGPRPWVCWS